jgi:hypothetical protein
VKAYKGDYAHKMEWREEEAVRISSTKFGKQILRIGACPESGQFRGYELPKDWSSFPLPRILGVMCLTEADYSEDPALIHPEVVEAQLQDYEALIIQKWTRTCFANHKH